MKKIYFIFICLFLFTSCKKSLESIAEDAVIKAMTDGQWVITNFTKDGANITSDFNGYRFQYYSNRTVDAIKNGTIEKTGSWGADAATMTTSANFTSPAYPLLLINGDWHITNNSWTFVEATQTNGSEVKTMRLDKQ
ncbi:MAG: hypothetical protein M3O67_08270 [Bacteroidota bacterium]|nr:hypothetical protein [Bacteroidota bacterium]